VTYITEAEAAACFSMKSAEAKSVALKANVHLDHV
jgi:hypothetical protein